MIKGGMRTADSIKAHCSLKKTQHLENRNQKSTFEMS